MENNNNETINQEFIIENNKEEIKTKTQRKRNYKKKQYNNKDNINNNKDNTNDNKELSLKEKLIEILKNMKTEKFNIQSEIDEIKVSFHICKEMHRCYCSEENENIKHQQLELKYIMRLTLEDIYFYGSFSNFVALTTGFVETPEELLEKIEGVKKLKWCKLKGNFIEEDEKNRNKLFDEFINDNETTKKLCSVCYERCDEILNCKHILCMQCKLKMIKNNNNYCPMCKTKKYNLNFIYDDDEENSGSEN